MSLKALIIGVGQREKDHACMVCTEHDAIQLNENLIKHCNVPGKNIYLFAGENATSQKINEGIEALGKDLIADEESDCLIIYFSGHAEKIEAHGVTEYRLICRAENDFLRSDLFIEKIKNLNAKAILFAFDCCHSNGINIPLSESSKENLNASFNRVILSSCREAETSLTASPVSLFTFALINGLVGDAISKESDEVRILDLALYVREVVKDRSGGHAQTPMIEILNDQSISNFSLVKPSLEIKSYKDLPFTTLKLCGSEKTIEYKGKESVAKDPEFREWIESLTINVRDSVVNLDARGATINIENPNSPIVGSPKDNHRLLQYGFKKMELSQFEYFCKIFNQEKGLKLVVRREQFYSIYKNEHKLFVFCIQKSIHPLVAKQINSKLGEFEGYEKILINSKKIKGNPRKRLKELFPTFKIFDVGYILYTLEKSYNRNENEDFISYAYQIGIEKIRENPAINIEVDSEDNYRAFNSNKNFIELDVHKIISNQKHDPEKIKEILDAVSAKDSNLSIDDVLYIKETHDEHFNAEHIFPVLLTLYLKRILNEKIGVEEIEILNSLLEKSKFDYPTLKDRRSRSVLFSIINYVSYSQSFVAQTDEFGRLLRILFKLDAQYWYPRTLDLYFNLKLNNDTLGRKIKKLIDEYLKFNDDLFYQRMRDYVVFPKATIERFKSKEVLFSEIENNLRVCTNSFQCSWYLKIYDHYSFFLHQIESSYMSRLEEQLKLLKSIKQRVRQGSARLLFIQMIVYLDLYKLTFDIKFLEEFERLYLKHSNILNIYYRNRLQLKYALSLYSKIVAKKDFSNGSYTFFKEKNWELKFKEFTLLYNESLEGCEDIFVKQKGRSKRKLFYNALIKYIKLQFNHNFKTQIENNILYASKFNELISVFEFSTEYQNTVCGSYLDFYGSELKASPTSYCRMFTTLGFVNFDRMPEESVEDLKIALKAPAEIIIKNGIGIFRFLHKMLTYYEYENQNKVSKKSVQKLLKKATKKVSEPLSKNMYFWVYIYGLDFEFESDNFDFLKRIYSLFNEKIILYFSDNEGFSIPINEISDVCKEYAAKASLANICSNFLNYSEIWNFFGTMIIDKAEAEDFPDKSIYDMASKFYAVGLYISRDNSLYDQKYSFNYINAMSNSMTYRKIVDRKFYFDVLHFLTEGNVERFIHAAGRTMSFFRLLNKNSNCFSEADLAHLDKVLYKNQWMKNQLHLCKSLTARIDKAHEKKWRQSNR